MATGSVSAKVGKILDRPTNAPTIGTATDLATGGGATVAFTAPSTAVGGPIFDYLGTSTPGSITATGTSSPLTFSGLTVGTSYTFTVAGRNPSGLSPLSSASNSITPTVPPFTSQLAYDSIASASLSGTTTVTFSSIPQTYASLEIVVYAKDSSTSGTYQPIQLTMNGATGATDYITTQFNRNSATSISASNNAEGSSIYANESLPSSRTSNPDWSSTYGYQVWRITDYQRTNGWKSVNMYYGYINSVVPASLTGMVGYLSGTYKSTSAVTSLTFTLSNNFASGSQIALYGIKQGV